MSFTLNKHGVKAHSCQNHNQTSNTKSEPWEERKPGGLQPQRGRMALRGGGDSSESMQLKVIRCETSQSY